MRIRLRENTKKIIITTRVNSKKEFNFNSAKKYDQSNGESKPKGLWYAYDNSWIDFLIINQYIDNDGVSKMEKDDTSVFNVNTVITAEIPQNLNILKLKTKNDLIRFITEYGYGSSRDIYETYRFQWDVLSKKYDGIEILEPIVYERDYSLNMYWDVPSGCIWNNLNKLKIVSVVPLTEYMKNDYKINNNEDNYEEESKKDTTEDEFHLELTTLDEDEFIVKVYKDSSKKIGWDYKIEKIISGDEDEIESRFGHSSEFKLYKGNKKEIDKYDIYHYLDDNNFDYDLGSVIPLD